MNDELNSFLTELIIKDEVITKDSVFCLLKKIENSSLCNKELAIRRLLELTWNSAYQKGKQNEIESLIKKFKPKTIELKN